VLWDMRLGGFLACDLKGLDSRTSLMCGLLPSLVEMQCVKKFPSSNEGDAIKYKPDISTYGTRVTLGQSPRQFTITNTV